MKKFAATKSSLLLSVLACVLALGLFVPLAGARDVAIANLEEYEPWDEEIVDLFAKLPVQDDGRIKPLETVARFRLYRVNGKRTLTFGIKPEGQEDVEKVKLSAVEWYLDCLFRPEVAVELPFILVDNVDVITEIGVTPHKTPGGTAVLRSRYTYSELGSALPDPEVRGDRGKLSEKRDTYVALQQSDPKAFERDLKKQQVLQLHDNMAVINYLLHMNDFARNGLAGNLAIGKISSELGDPGAGGTPLSEWLEKFNQIPAAAAAAGYDPQSVEGLMKQLTGELTNRANIAGGDPDNPIAGVSMFAPADQEDDDWTSIGEEIIRSADLERPHLAGVERVRTFEELVASTGNQKNFEKIAKPFIDQRIREAKARGEYSKVPLELKYYDMHFIANAMPWFIFGFLFVALSWLTPGSAAGRFLGWASVATCILGTCYVVGAVIMRCMIMGRPPISTLYETILFIVASAVILCLILEYFDRRKVALAVAAVIGGLGMFLALRYEIKEAVDGKGDTMVTLPAVLRSNFWLGTHVIIINLGYASGLLASGLSMVYIGSRLPHGWRADNEMERSITRMVYGIVCFTLLFSLVGTVLGGVWANDSWGRFWGWDPKENGALMIVLWSLVILHARMGGYIKRIGLHAASVMLGLITVFSWWGVNLLDIGLHSYGRTSGVAEILAKVYWFGAAFIVAAGALWLVEYSVRKDRLERKSAAEN